jgi:hypothetical protein
MSDESQVVDFAPVQVGNPLELPPDAPEGEWRATCRVKKMKSQKTGYPMLCVEWTLSSALDPENVSFEGTRVSDWIVFGPPTWRGAKMARQKLNELCTHCKVQAPDASSLAEGSWASLDPFIADLETGEFTIFTRHRKQKDGTLQCEISYKPKSIL